MNQMEEKSSDLVSMWTPLPETVRGYTLMIDANPKTNMMAYCNGRFVYLRSLENPNIGDLFTEHKIKANVARFSPNGELIASGDDSGRVLIWVIKTKNIKLEVRVNRKITDLTWSDDGQRICAVGEGAEAFAKVFTADAGNNIGEIVGHSKIILGCAYKPSRPYKIVTVSEDNSVIFHQGPPFKMQSIFREHTRYPNCVRYSPNGNFFITVGADRQIFLFDGKEGTKLKEFGTVDPNGHSASILSLSWSPDSKYIVTCSMDRTAKIWDVELGTVLKTFTFGDGVSNQQVGTLWCGKFIYSVGLNGFMHVLDFDSGSFHTIKGHQSNISGCILDKANNLWTCDNSGNVLHWATDMNGTNVALPGTRDKSLMFMEYDSNNSLVTTGVDNMLTWSSIDGDAKYGTDSLALNNLPIQVLVQSDRNLVVASLLSKQLVVVVDRKCIQRLELTYEATSLAFHPGKSLLVVGGSDFKVRFFAFNPDSGLTLKDELTLSKHDGAVSAIAYTPDFKFLITCGKDRLIYIFEEETLALQNDGWQLHTGAITDVCFVNSKMITCSIDQSIIVWSDLTNKTKRKQLLMAHIGGVDKIRAFGDQLVSTGCDRTIRLWKV